MKSEITKQIEAKLAKKFHLTSYRYAFEVPVFTENKSGIADFVTIHLNTYESRVPIINVYEIKVSVSDFKSKNGHNLIGDRNYYVVTKEVWDYLQNNKYSLNYGVIVFDNNRLITKKESFEIPINRSIHIEDRFKILDDVLIKWESGTMYRMLKEYGLELRNG